LYCLPSSEFLFFTSVWDRLRRWGIGRIPLEQVILALGLKLARRARGESTRFGED
jgi:hypothetical protein